ncbi:hypothetical protein CUS_5562 [Ruminococcus albus 8]|uniref:Uncharacterized protein n=1 Tax=Ruminococcus albus 8 TaxID=246199 RepID=E9S946_RUMAL|nr:hypothetical protein CUS_5562 [Ruminococcus albus 8]
MIFYDYPKSGHLKCLSGISLTVCGVMLTSVSTNGSSMRSFLSAEYITTL